MFKWFPFLFQLYLSPDLLSVIPHSNLAILSPFHFQWYYFSFQWLSLLIPLSYSVAITTTLSIICYWWPHHPLYTVKTHHNSSHKLPYVTATHKQLVARYNYISFTVLNQTDATLATNCPLWLQLTKKLVARYDYISFTVLNQIDATLATSCPVWLQLTSN